jgi:hypothetical protein
VGTITFTGGSTAQQQAVTTAHGRLTTGLPRAVTAAAGGTGSFASWFGNTQASQTETVTAELQACANSLAQQNFSYDLTGTLPMLLQRTNCVLFASIAGGTVSAQLWDGLWSTYYLDQPAGASVLVLGVFHELAVSFNPAVVDIVSVDSAAAALSLAAADPVAAAHCPVNLAGFLAQFLPT